MEIIKRPGKVDLSLYSKEAPNREVKFGLPSEVRFCTQCVMSNQKPNSAQEYKHTQKTKKLTLDIDADGICSACRNTAAKEVDTNWDERHRQLVELCDRHRRQDGHYDCLVPGSGGKDSFYTAHLLKYKYGMNPLTVTFAPHIYTNWGWKNFQSWIHAGFDNYLFTPNGRVHRLLTRLATEIIFHPFQPFMMGQMYFAPQMAERLNIPLVFYGENAAEYGNPIEENKSAKKDTAYYSTANMQDVHLGGVQVNDLVKDFGLSWGDLAPYLPADPDRLEKKKIEVHYLGYYVKWHPQGTYYYSVEHGGFESCPERNPGTYSKYSSIDDKIDDFHFYTTYIKFGIGRATYDASQEIRNKDISREEGQALVKRFDGEFPERFADEILKYLSVPSELVKASRMFEQTAMDRDYFTDLVNQNRSPHLWKYEDGRWSLRHQVW